MEKSEMFTKPSQHLCAIVLLAGLTLGSGALLAQSYPSKPVRIVVAAAAGGGLDRVGRLFGQKLGEAWKLPVLVENRGGAGGTIASDMVAKAAPDGYTVLLNSTALAINPNIYRKLPFDALRDFAPLSRLTSSVLVLVVNSQVPARSVAELIALAKARPGRLNYGSSGVGASPHLAAELFKLVTGIDIVHVPYKGSAPVIRALLADEVQMEFGSLGSFGAHIPTGRLRALAVTGAARWPALPEAPTMAEAGVPNYELSTWLGLFAPAGTPRDMLGSFHAAIVKAIASPEVRQGLVGMGYEPVGSTPEEFDARYKADIAQYARIIKEARIPLQD